MFDVAAIVAAWSPAIPPQHAVAIVSVLVFTASASGDEPPPVATRLLEFDPSIEVGIGDLIRLRAILARQLANQPQRPETVAASLRLHGAVDDLIAAIAERQVDRLERTALLDELTGVGNRRAMDRELASAVSHALRHAAPLAVAMIDLDGLKRVNDTEGHAAGDEMIRSMGRLLAGNARGGDSVYRIGGDEFLVVARDSRPPEVEALLTRVRPEAPVFSAGIAGLPEDGSDAPTLLRVADARLYAGRGERVVVVPSATAARSRSMRGSRGVLLVPAAAVLAEGVRHRRGVDVRGADLAAWTAATAGGTLALAGAGWWRGLRLPRISTVAAATLGSLLLLLPVLEHEDVVPPPVVAAPSAGAPVRDLPALEPGPAPVGPSAEGVTPGPDAPGTLAPPTTVLVDPVLVVSTPQSPGTRPPAAPPRPGEAGGRPPVDDDDGGPVIDDDDDLEAADLDPPKPRRKIGRGDPHQPGAKGDPHVDGHRGDPHRSPNPGRGRQR